VSTIPIALLETKLHLPTLRQGHVARLRLGQRLDVETLPALTLISAPPGFGKTSLLAEWLAGSATDRTVAWVSLDPGDNDPVSFWTYVISALGRAEPGVGDRSLALLGESPGVDFRTLLTLLLNDLASAVRDVVLVLDDYHVIEATELQEGVAFLVGSLPPQLRTVIASRSDPPFPLARLRGRGELLELRAADLRFTRQEADEYLSGMLRVQVRPAHVDALEQRTEGWIAALQLAALSMQRVDDVGAFVEGFAGDDRYILDYLVEEVLDHQSADVRGFLLRTSILSRLTGPLCDAVAGGSRGTAHLEALDRANLFVVPLDDRRRWYRYHHLFGDVLQARLVEELPELVPELHRRASEWFEQNGEPGDAVRHALGGGDPERAADLIESTIPAMRQSRREATLRRWLDALPDDVFPDRPALAVAAAGSRLGVGETSLVEERLGQAARSLASPATSAAHPGLSGWVAIYRSASAQLRGDLVATVQHADEALRLIAADDGAARGAVQSLRGIADWSRGDLDAAYAAFSAGMDSLGQAGFVTDVVGGTVVLADIRIAQGRPSDARTLYEQALLRGTAGGAELRGIADMHVGLAALDIEADDLAGAQVHLRQSDELGEHKGFPQNPYRSRVVRARLAELRGDPAVALALVDEASEVFTSDFSPNVRPIPALRARMVLRLGRLDEAARWADGRMLGADDELGYLSEYEHLTLARILVAQARRSPAGPALRQAVALLSRLLQAAESGSRGGSVVEALALLALASRLQNDSRSAFRSLDRALTLAEPQGHVRLFLDEGRPMEGLIRSAASRADAPRFAGALLTAFAQAWPADEAHADVLTDRELGVLRLLATDLSGPDIARQLVVSLNTVRTHSKNIYSKLGVGDRRAAVRRAGELGLLRSPRP
jgi:LuxR family maltose regulon positive regulatory protein